MSDRTETGRLRDRWAELWQRLGAQMVPEDVFEALLTAYSAPDRFYHTIVHIEDCLLMLDQTKTLATHPDEIELAIWFHDSVYDTKRSDNEHRSAEWAKAVVHQVFPSQPTADIVYALILATRHTEPPTDTNARLLVDVDLSILGREPREFWHYEENIRKEYGWVPESVFREKRAEILTSFLARPSIYFHKEYQALFEQKARANLIQAITKLMPGTGPLSLP